jgi:hypothetical protein
VKLFRWAIVAYAVPVLLVFGTAGVATAEQWQVGDQVQAYNVDWYDATIAEVGSGDREGYYLVKWDDFAGQQYIAEANIRARPGSAQPATSSGATALTGRYTCYGYPGPGGQFRWYLQVGDDAYEQQTPDLPVGHYLVDAGDSSITFTDGPYADIGWFGRLESDKVVLRSVASEQQGPRVDEYANIYCSK